MTESITTEGELVVTLHLAAVDYQVPNLLAGKTGAIVSPTAAEADPESMLHLYRRAVAHRRASKGLSGEAFAWAEMAGDVVAFARGEVLVVVNVGGTPVALPDGLVGDRTMMLCSVPGHDDARVLPADAAAWLAAS